MCMEIEKEEKEIMEKVQKLVKAEKSLDFLENYFSHIPSFFYDKVGCDDDIFFYINVSSTLKPHIKHLFKRGLWEETIYYYYLPKKKLSEAYSILKSKNISFTTLERHSMYLTAKEKISSYCSSLRSEILQHERKLEDNVFDFVKKFIEEISKDYEKVEDVPSKLKFSNTIFSFSSPHSDTHEILIKKTDDDNIIEIYHRFVDEDEYIYYSKKSYIQQLEQLLRQEEEERERRIEEERKKRDEENRRFLKEIEEKKKRILAVLDDFGDIFEIRKNDFSLEVRFKKFVPRNQFTEIISILRNLGFTYLVKSKTWYKSF